MTRPRLNLRDLFWLVLVVALAVGWWHDRRSQEQRLSVLENDVAQKLTNSASIAELMEINAQLVRPEEQEYYERLQALLKDSEASADSK